MLPWDEEQSREEGSKRQLKGRKQPQTATEKPAGQDQTGEEAAEVTWSRTEGDCRSSKWVDPSFERASRFVVSF